MNIDYSGVDRDTVAAGVSVGERVSVIVADGGISVGVSVAVGGGGKV